MGFLATDSSIAKKRALRYKNFIRQTAVLGGQVFGPIPKDVRREFFCLDERTWVWHEEWTDHAGQRHVQTTRYDIRYDGIVKCQNDGPYVRVSPEETNNLYKAMIRYRDLISFRYIKNNNSIADNNFVKTA